ncbi:unnamed protein product [Polarella glacialis]|uniref:Uncharacterized protein n=4 Tax=Polarella glacialis TaxID=89957 RepID=A0A813G8Z2_POLGL|nr:unnamed protein product [Polarella glacialis]
MWGGPPFVTEPVSYQNQSFEDPEPEATYVKVVGLAELDGFEQPYSPGQLGHVATSRDEESQAASAWMGIVRKELAELDERLSRHLLRLQQQNERVLEVVVQSLEGKVAEVMSKQPMTEWRLSELTASLKGLQEQMELQAQRGDAADSRFQRFRSRLEADLETKFEEQQKDLLQLSMELRSLDPPELRPSIENGDGSKKSGLKLLQDGSPCWPSLAAGRQRSRGRPGQQTPQESVSRRELAEVADALQALREEIAQGALSTEAMSSDHLQLDIADVTAAASTLLQEEGAALRNELRAALETVRIDLVAGMEGVKARCQLLEAGAPKALKGPGLETDAGKAVVPVAQEVCDTPQRSRTYEAELEKLLAEASASRHRMDAMATLLELANTRLDVAGQQWTDLAEEVKWTSLCTARLEEKSLAVDAGRGLRHAEVSPLAALPRVEALESAGSSPRSGSCSDSVGVSSKELGSDRLGGGGFGSRRESDAARAVMQVKDFDEEGKALDCIRHELRREASALWDGLADLADLVGIDGARFVQVGPVPSAESRTLPAYLTPCEDGEESASAPCRGPDSGAEVAALLASSRLLAKRLAEAAAEEDAPPQPKEAPKPKEEEPPQPKEAPKPKETEAPKQKELPKPKDEPKDTPKPKEDTKRPAQASRTNDPCPVRAISEPVTEMPSLRLAFSQLLAEQELEEQDVEGAMGPGRRSESSLDEVMTTTTTSLPDTPRANDRSFQSALS